MQFFPSFSLDARKVSATTIAYRQQDDRQMIGCPLCPVLFNVLGDDNAKGSSTCEFLAWEHMYAK